MPRPTPKAPECKRCRAVIRFVELESHNFMPCDPIPDPAGSVVARKVDLGGDRVRFVDGYVLKNGRNPTEGWTRFRPHWIDCKPADPTAPDASKPARAHTPTLF